MMSISPMNFQNHLQRHQDLIRERANDRLTNQIAAHHQMKIFSQAKNLLTHLIQRARQHFARPIPQPCPPPILREFDI